MSIPFLGSRYFGRFFAKSLVGAFLGILTLFSSLQRAQLPVPLGNFLSTGSFDSRLPGSKNYSSTPLKPLNI